MWKDPDYDHSRLRRFPAYLFKLTRVGLAPPPAAAPESAASTPRHTAAAAAITAGTRTTLASKCVLISRALVAFAPGTHVTVKTVVG